MFDLQKEATLGYIQENKKVLSKLIPFGFVFPGKNTKWEELANIIKSSCQTVNESSREPLYRDSLSHHRTSDVAYGGFAVMFTKS